MTRILFSIMIALFALAAAAPGSGVAATSASTAPAVVADSQETPPQAPQGVSPADPSIKPPVTGEWYCWRCGAGNPNQGAKYKGRHGGPMLAQGAKGAQGARGQRGFAARQGCGKHSKSMHDGGMMGRGKGMRGDGMMGHGKGVAADRMLRQASELNLTDDQTAKLEALAYETKKRLIDLHADIEIEQLEVHKQLQSGSEDLTQIKRHWSAIAKAQVDIKEAQITNLFEARKLLTTEQKEMVKERHPRLGMILD
jgi:Spy/CpxP family protein refolding chaperone